MTTHKKHKTLNGNKPRKRRSYLWIFVLGAAISCLAYLMIIGSQRQTEQNVAVGSYQAVEDSGPTRFCTNTILSVLDSNKELVKGKQWLATNSDIFEPISVFPNQTQVGLTYHYWMESKDFFVRPVTFTPRCGDELDTNPDYIQVDAYEFAKPTIIVRDLVYFEDNISSSCAPEGCTAMMQIEYIENNKEAFMPLGGVLVIEYKNLIYDVSCQAEDQEVLSYPPYHLIYTPHTVSNTYKIFGLEDFDRGNALMHKIRCQFNYAESAKDKISGTEIYVNFIPSNFYVTKEKHLVLDTEKFADEDLTRVVKEEVVKKLYFKK